MPALSMRSRCSSRRAIGVVVAPKIRASNSLVLLERQNRCSRVPMLPTEMRS
jgi:hypothetical protein